MERPVQPIRTTLPAASVDWISGFVNQDGEGVLPSALDQTHNTLQFNNFQALRAG